jgi:hypothetical protein
MAATESPGAEPAPGEAAPEAINQGATGARPLGESPASVGSDTDAFDERPEAFVGAAFVGGFALALILRRVVR